MPNASKQAQTSKRNPMVRAQQLRSPAGFWIACDKLMPNSLAINAERRQCPSDLVQNGAAAQAGKRSAARLGGVAADLSAAPHGNHGDNHKTRSAQV